MSCESQNNILLVDSPGAATIRQLRQWVDNGVLAQGVPLPSERELSTKLAVSRVTVRRALAALVRDGVIRRDGPRIRLVSGPRSSASVGQGVMSHSIAVLGPSFTPGRLIGKQEGWVDSFLPGVYAQISDQEYNLFSIHVGRLTEADLRRVIDGRPMGVVCPEIAEELQGNRQKWLEAFRRAEIPIVAYGDSPDLQTYDRVASDHDAGSYELTRWLLAQGRRRIEMLVSSLVTELYWVRGRRSGYERAMREAGLESRPTIQYEPCPFAPEPTRAYFDKASRHMVGYLVEHLSSAGGRQPLDALVLESDGIAYPVAAACRLLGRNPGSDISLAGYDGYALDCPERQFEPCGPQVTMDKRNEEIGREMVRLLIDRCEGRLPATPQVRLVRPELVVLDSLNAASGEQADALTKT